MSHHSTLVRWLRGMGLNRLGRRRAAALSRRREGGGSGERVVRRSAFDSFERLEPRVLLAADITLTPTGGTGIDINEVNGLTVVDVSAGATVQVTAGVANSDSSNINIFQLDFSSSDVGGGGLSLSNWSTDAAWPGVSFPLVGNVDDGTIDDDQMVIGTAMPGNGNGTLGTFDVTVPASAGGGEWLLTADVEGSFDFEVVSIFPAQVDFVSTGTALVSDVVVDVFNPGFGFESVGAFDDVLFRVLPSSLPTVSVGDVTAAEGDDPAVTTVSLDGTVRDFIGEGTTAPSQGGASAHTDFEDDDALDYRIANPGVAVDGAVGPTLGGDGDPVFVGGTTFSTGPAFDQWFDDDASVNMSMPLSLDLTFDGQQYVYAGTGSGEFYPIDGALFGNTNGAEIFGDPVSPDHNWHFTYEGHSSFVYEPGQTLTVTSDDDVWVFIDGDLVLERGGVNIDITRTLNLDTVAGDLGLTAGSTYDLDLFYAERHTVDAVLQIETNIPLGVTTSPTFANFDVTLSEATTVSTTVEFFTEDGSALAGADYVSTTGTLTFAPGQTTQQVRVPLIGNALTDGDLDFSLKLSNPTLISIADDTGQGTIEDDDGAGMNELDFGDANESLGYPVTLAQNGARHVLGGSLELGGFVTVDAEADGQPSADASGDDVNGSDDEDGIEFRSPTWRGRDFRNTAVRVTEPGFVNAWADFNQDGDWNDNGEHVIDDRFFTSSSSVAFPIPSDAMLGDTFIRYRVSSQENLGPTGEAPDGEVEDYILTIEEGLGTGSIGGFIWNDLDGDGIQDTGEPGLPGLTVNLNQNGGLFAFTSTDANGEYLFTDLPASDNYEVQVFNPVDFISVTVQDAGADDAVDSDLMPAATGNTRRTAVFSLAEGATDLTRDGGYILPTPPPGSIGDFVWDDQNGNGVQDPSEPGLEGVVVRLIDDDGATELDMTTSDSAGAYGFADVTPGDYFVQFDAVSGFSLTDQFAGGSAEDSDPDPGTGRTGLVTVAAGQDREDIDAGYVADVAFFLDRGTQTVLTGTLGDIPASYTQDSGGQTGGYTSVDTITSFDPVSITRTQYDLLNSGNEALTEFTITFEPSVTPLSFTPPTQYINPDGSFGSFGGSANSTILNMGFGTYQYDSASEWQVDYQSGSISFQSATGIPVGSAVGNTNVGTTGAFNVSFIDGTEFDQYPATVAGATNEATGMLLSASTATLPAVTLTAPDADAAEPDNPGQFLITRTGSTIDPLTVDFFTGGDAVPDVDYDAVGTSATIPAGQASVAVDINPVDDDVSETVKTVELTLTSDGSAYALGASFMAAVTLTDDDVSTDGQLDTTFSGDGFTETDVPEEVHDDAVAVLVQPDKKVIVVGRSFRIENFTATDTNMALVRYNTDGSIDTTFGDDGFVATEVDFLNINDAALQPDGKIVVVGNNVDGVDADLLVQRFNADGSLDNSFGARGTVIVGTNQLRESATDVALQPDGKIVVAVSNTVMGVLQQAAVARLNTDGSLDNTFGVQGVAALDFGDPATTSVTPRGVAVTPAGRVLLLGQFSGGGLFQGVLAQFDSSGQPDAAFGTNGAVDVQVAGESFPNVQELVVQDSGRIIVGIEALSQIVFNAYNPDGSTDDTFGTAGSTNVDVPGDFEDVNDVKVQSDGKIVFAGGASFNQPVFTLTGYVGRLTGDGQPDTNFGTNGVTLANAANPALILHQFNGVAVDSMGGVAAAGTSDTDPVNFSTFVVARFTGSIEPFTEIDVTGNGLSIADGDDTPDEADHTLFPNTALDGGVSNRVFTIVNQGNTDITLTGSPLVEVTGADDRVFTVTSQPDSSVIPAGGQTEFTVAFDPDDERLLEASLVIPNTDGDENPYTFDIAGEGVTQIMVGELGGDSGQSKATFPDAMGNEFEISAPGSANVMVLQEGSGRLSLMIENPDARSSLTIKNKNKDGDNLFDSIVSDGPLKSINAKGIDFAGDIMIDGHVGSFTGGDVAEQHIVSFGGLPTDKAMKLTFENFIDVTFTAGAPVQLTLTSWQDTDPEENKDSLTAPSATNLQTKGDRKSGAPGTWDADVTLTGESAPKGVALKKFLSAGGGGAPVFNITGDVSSFEYKDHVETLTLTINSELKKLKGTTFGSASVSVETAGTLEAVEWPAGEVTVDVVKTLKIKGDKKTGAAGDAGFNLTVVGDPSAKTVANSISIAGAASGAWRLTGPVGNTTVGSATSDFSAVIAGAAKGFTSKGNFDGTLAAHEFAKIDIKGSADGARLIAGGDISGGLAETFIKSLKVSGSMNASLVEVGLDFVNNDPDDFVDFVGGDSHFIKSMSVGGEADSSNLFTAGLFPKTVSLNKVKVDPLDDPEGRFDITPV